MTKTIDPNEAPEGFYAAKPTKNGNCFSPLTEGPCSECDAVKLCLENANGWSFNNSCIKWSITKNGITKSRKDGCDVVFKKRPEVE